MASNNENIDESKVPLNETSEIDKDKSDSKLTDDDLEPEKEPMLKKKPKVPAKPKKSKPTPARRQKANPEPEVKPTPIPRKLPSQSSQLKENVDIDATENQPHSESKPVHEEPPVPAIRHQPSYSSQITRQSAEVFDNTGDSGQVQTFNFNQPQMAEYDQDQPSPTGFLGWVGFGCSVFALACLCVSFSSPYWMQTYPMSFNTFRNMGLWELCMHDYMHHKDDSQEIYNGCWWVFNRAEKYWKLREWVLPPWFITCQVLSVMCLMCSIATVGLIAMIFLHFCPIMNHEYHQSYAMFAASGLCFFNTILTLIIGLMYGLLCGDRQWMPRPDLNFISWGYGFMIIQGIISTAAGVAYFLEAQKAFNELDRRDQEYTKAVLDLETSAYPPSYGPPVESYGQPSYDAGSVGYSDQPPYKHSQSYASQPSYDPGYSQVGYNSGGYNSGGYDSGGGGGGYGEKGYEAKA